MHSSGSHALQIFSFLLLRCCSGMDHIQLDDVQEQDLFKGSPMTKQAEGP